MTTLPNMGIVLPVNAQDIGTWGTKLNVALPLVDAHDHTSGKGVQVPSAGINIDANLSFGGWAITAAGQVAFQAVAALVAGSKVLFVSSADNELYWRTNGGTNVKLTSGSSINTTLVGGIVGDYTSVSAEVAYDDATDSYTFKQQGSPKPWARLRAGTVRIYEQGTTETVYVALNAPGVLGASYDLTFASALPGAQTMVQVDATGQLVYSNTLAANQSITLSGTGEYKHGDKKIARVVTIESAFTFSGAGHSAVSSGNASGIQVANGADTRFQIYGLRQGMRLKSIALVGTAANEPNIAIYDQVQNAASSLGFSTTGTIVTNGRRVYTLNTPLTIGSDDEAIIVSVAGAGSTANIYTVQAVYDIP